MSSEGKNESHSGKKRAREETGEPDSHIDKKVELPSKKKPIRVWADGCFDLMHWGHANALRQAKECGDYLVVGVHSDKEVIRNKGPPVMNEQERYAAVRACKWVDEVVEDAPYNTTLAMLDKHDIDFCVHGEDISTDENGRDTYWEVKEANRYKTIKRSDGVSTTDIVGRMILLSKDHLSHHASEQSAIQNMDIKQMDVMRTPETGISHFLPTTRRIVQFAVGSKPLKSTDTVVYIDGAFDLFHVGHIEALKKAKDMGDYLIVGVHDDQVVNKIKGSNLPILNLHERVLSVLACRHANEVVIGAPWKITKDMIQNMNVNIVAHGTCSDYPKGIQDPYVVAREVGIYKEFKSSHEDLTTTKVLDRILENRLLYIERNRKKQAKEKVLNGGGASDPASSPTSSSLASHLTSNMSASLQKDAKEKEKADKKAQH